ncbi:MAG: hypothetical protein ACWA41_13095 [Putridiphycobacter sp.]
MKKTMMILLGSLLVYTSCKKDDPETTLPTEVKGDAQALKNFFSNNESNSVQNFTIDAQNPQQIIGAGGLTVNFNANAFETTDGQTVIGNVDISLIEIYNKKDMILLNKPTVGVKDNGDLAPLVSGGEFKISATQNGLPLELKQDTNFVTIVPAPNGTDSQMSLFSGEVTNDTLIWSFVGSSALNVQASEYFAMPNSLGWINCDFFYNFPAEMTSVEVEIPQGFTNETCYLFISFDGLNSLLNFYQYSSGVFSTNLPVGSNVHFVAISIINGNPHVAIVAATIQNGHYEIISGLTQTTGSQFEADLANLP